MSPSIRAFRKEGSRLQGKDSGGKGEESSARADELRSSIGRVSGLLSSATGASAGLLIAGPVGAGSRVGVRVVGVILVVVVGAASGTSAASRVSAGGLGVVATAVTAAAAGCASGTGSTLGGVVVVLGNARSAALLVLLGVGVAAVALVAVTDALVEGNDLVLRGVGDLSRMHVSPLVRSLVFHLLRENVQGCNGQGSRCRYRRTCQGKRQRRPEPGRSSMKAKQRWSERQPRR